MAANKFATMLYRNTHKMIVILVYALLEWVLILLLLLNSFFSYLIRKFADYFGLKPPCPWCSSISHSLEPNKKNNYYRDLVCEAHAKEISQLQYCPNHQKLAESERFCSDCSPPQPIPHERNAVEISSFTWREERTNANGERDYQCSCCEHPSGHIYEYNQKRYLILETYEDVKTTSKASGSVECCCDHNHEMKQTGEFSRQALNFCCDALEDHEFDKSDIIAVQEQDFSHADSVDRSLDEASMIRITKNNHEFDPLIPVGLIDSPTISRRNSSVVMEEDLLGEHEEVDEKFASKQWIQAEVNLIRENETVSADATLEMLANEGEVQTRDRVLEIESPSMLMAEPKIQGLSFSAQAPRASDTVSKQWIQPEVDLIRENGTVSADAAIEIVVNEGEVQMSYRVLEIENSSMLMSEPNIQGPVFNFQPSWTSDVETAAKEQKAASQEEDACKSQADETASEPVLDMETSILDPNGTRAKEMYFSADSYEETNFHLCKSSEANETEDENFPVAPTRIDDLHQLVRKQFENRGRVEEKSWDGTEMEGDDGIERLKAELEAQRKALSSLYTELEEERSAAAIATNQTMAMITRLQEEKAAMQMEALQYQRMMDEQSEYDQEALQLLNELMVKREKEKQELEKELEMYRKKASEGERMKLTRRKSGSVKSRCSSASCSNAEDNEELFTKTDCEERQEDDDILGLKDCLKHLGILEESVKEFEEERLSILDELKELEEKLFTLVDSDQEKLLEQSTAYFSEECSFSKPEENEVSNGLSEDTRGEIKMRDLKATKLLPLFDATTSKNEEDELNEEVARTENSLATNEMGKRDGIEADIDHVYERLHALEADREFVKHCASSLKKGDKGLDLLQEILQHLRDLKAVETQARNINNI